MSGRRTKKRKKQNLMIVAASACITAAILILLLALWLLLGGKKEAEPAVPAEAKTEESVSDEELSGESPSEDPQTALESEELKAEVPVSTVKEIASETDEMTVGIDVSEFQGNIDWDQVSQSGIDFVIVRAGYRSAGSGVITEDACARYNLQEAAARGIHLGAYFFSTAVSEEEAREEAKWMKEFLAGYPITYPVAYNCEGFQNASSRQYGLTVEERSHLAQVFLDELEGNLLWNTDELELKYRIWVAQYSSSASDQPDYTGAYAMWQYTNQGSVPGIGGAVDLDMAWFGYSETALAQEEGTAEHVEANLEVGVTFEEVEEQVTSKDVTNLRSSMEQGDDSNVVTQLKNGETATRTGRGNNGWSRVVYNGQTLYAVSSYLTTDLSYTTPVEEPDDGFKTRFTAVTENVTAKDVTNLRNRPSVEEPSEVIVQLHNGEVIARTGVSELGWSRVEYNGQTLYCISSYLQVVD